ncbi:hypothetical protein EV401DRAFT_1942351 [Pisolithus croceorrhizus]|nr:hypothetical protein EV401DRAFT_1942351 [Pisolithus croceorrhizus]
MLRCSQIWVAACVGVCLIMIFLAEQGRLQTEVLRCHQSVTSNSLEHNSQPRSNFGWCNDQDSGGPQLNSTQTPGSCLSFFCFCGDTVSSTDGNTVMQTAVHFLSTQDSITFAAVEGAPICDGRCTPEASSFGEEMGAAYPLSSDPKTHQ